LLTGLDAYRLGLAPRIWLSGGRRWWGVAEAVAMATWLENRGVTSAHLGLELCSLTTSENAAYCRRQWPQARHVVLVTSRFHTPRAVECFERAGFECRPHPAPDGALSLRTRWLEEARGWARAAYARLGCYEASRRSNVARD
jgi:uncharacterized SAM-binding protein YcdF (DUF218 family)